MTKAENIASFVLRFTQELWHDAEGEPHIQWRGHIRHVQGDEEDRFTNFAEAVAFIQRYLTRLTLDALSGKGQTNQEELVQESFKLWEQLASSYADVMFQAMERTLNQSEAIQEYIDEAAKNALAAWQLPAQPDQKQMIEALAQLQTQLQALTDKVERLEAAIIREPDRTNTVDAA